MNSTNLSITTTINWNPHLIDGQQRSELEDSKLSADSIDFAQIESPQEDENEPNKREKGAPWRFSNQANRKQVKPIFSIHYLINESQISDSEDSELSADQNGFPQRQTLQENEKEPKKREGKAWKLSNSDRQQTRMFSSTHLTSIKLTEKKKTKID